jgi:TonB family protein
MLGSLWWRRLPLLAIIALSATQAAAQVIAGRVIDERSRLPLRGMTVAVIGDSAQQISQTTTDTTGIFSTNPLAAGTYRLRFSLDTTTSFESPPIQLAADGYVEREFIVPFMPRIYLASEVKQVQTLSHSPVPRYPADLRKRGVEGEVIAQFVVDSTGRVVPGSFKAIHYTDPGFLDALRAVIYEMRFQPAELNGRKVNQLVQEPFTFGIGR